MDESTNILFIVIILHFMSVSTYDKFMHSILPSLCHRISVAQLKHEIQ